MDYFAGQPVVDALTILKVVTQYFHLLADDELRTAHLKTQKPQELRELKELRELTKVP